MEAISFPISREAACCGIYMYLGSTRVGMKSKEQLRSEFLRMYEDSYKSGLERRRKRTLKQRARVENPSLAGDTNVATASSFLSMLNSLPKSTSKPEIVIENDYWFEVGFEWVPPAITSSKIRNEESLEWSANGVDLFSIVVEKPVDTVQKSKSDTVFFSNVVKEPAEDFFEDEDSIWDADDIWEGDEDTLEASEPNDRVVVSEKEVSVVEQPNPGQSISWEDPEDIWESDEDDIWVNDSEEDTVDMEEVIVPEPVKAPEPTKPSYSPTTRSKSYEVGRKPNEVIPPRNTVGNISQRPAKKPDEVKTRSFAEVKNAPKPVVNTVIYDMKLDENAIRDFVKTHKLCSESDIFSAFPSQDRTKVRAVIKSALRKYKIFEKHGKFTV